MQVHMIICIPMQMLHVVVFSQANAFRNSHRIYVSGPDVPDAVESFEKLSSAYSLPHYIIKNVTSMDYQEPTPIQMQAIPLMLRVSLCSRMYVWWGGGGGGSEGGGGREREREAGEERVKQNIRANQIHMYF